MSNSFRAFLSCSHLSEDKPVVDFFRKLISALSITPVTYDRQEINGITEEVQELIKGCDCFIGLATRREKIEGSETWTTTDWVQQETAFARACAKPIGLLVEDGVRFGGFTELDVRRTVFRRDKPLDTIDSMFSYLFSIRARLDESIGQRAHLKNLTFSRDRVHVRESFDKDHFTFTCDVTMESLTDDLRVAYHGTILEDETPGLSIFPEKFEFLCRESPADLVVSAIPNQASQRRHIWTLAFDPLLKQGQKVRYSYRITRHNNWPFTLEDAEQRIAHLTYHHDKPVCKALDWTIAYPTKEIFYELELPPGYEIRNPCVHVSIGNVVAVDEIKRINIERRLNVNKLFDAWSLTLYVPSPLYGHNYSVVFTPPGVRQTSS